MLCIFQDRDPFWEPADIELLLGTVHLHLMSIAHKLDVEENLTITNYKGNEMGEFSVSLFKFLEPLQIYHCPANKILFWGIYRNLPLSLSVVLSFPLSFPFSTFHVSATPLKTLFGF